MTRDMTAPVLTIADTADDDEIVEDIVLELKKGTGRLNDHRGEEGRQVPLDKYVREEVRHSLDRRRRDNRSLGFPDAVARQIDAVTREIVKLKKLLPPWLPPPQWHWTGPTGARMDAELYADACEAFDLVTMFSEKPPTLTDGSPFRLITAYLFYARTGKQEKQDESTGHGLARNICQRVLDTRRDILDAHKPPKT